MRDLSLYTTLKKRIAAASGHIPVDRGGLVNAASIFLIGAKPNLYCEAIELVCGGSPKVCVLIEWKALERVKSKL